MLANQEVGRGGDVERKRASVMLTMCICPRQLIFLRKSDCLGCAVLPCCVVCLTLLGSFFLPSHLSLNIYMYTCTHVQYSTLYGCSVLYCTVSFLPPDQIAAGGEQEDQEISEQELCPVQQELRHGRVGHRIAETCMYMH